jgi:hypothetical protein
MAFPATVFLLAQLPILRGADEHLHEIVVQRVVKLALKAPLELRVVEIAGMQIEIVSVNRHAFVLEADNDFYAFAFGTGRKGQQWMFVERELSEHAVESTLSARHDEIVNRILSYVQEVCTIEL